MKTFAFIGALALAAAVAAPATSFAQMFAYVNTSGEVMTIDAANAQAALNAAPGIHARSGVMEVSSDDSDVVGDDVPVS